MNISVGKDQCERWCLMDNKCVSVNIGSEKSPNSVICELSDSDHCQHPEDLKPRQGWTYRGAKNPCCYNPCLNNGKCLLGYTDKNYVCECPSGFTGAAKTKSMNAAPGAMIAMKMQLVQIRLETSTAHARQALLEMDGHVQMSMNVAPGSMIAMKMQLVQIRLETSTAHARQALLVMDGRVQIVPAN
ncbi:uncharacterized protein [Montipora capricornis]|uniref:uncharacterized protein n=1 Tax=Montipora capricornis TaxID=246305 RepID=UPI0035F0FE31